MNDLNQIPLRQRSIVKSCNPKCDICHLPKNQHQNHAKCSKIRQAKFAAMRKA